MDRRGRRRGAGMGGAGMGGVRPGAAAPAWAGKQTFTGGGDRPCGAGPTKERGRSIKEARRVSRSGVGGVNGRTGRLGSASPFREQIACGMLFSLSPVDELLSKEYSEGDGGRVAEPRLDSSFADATSSD